MGLDLYTLKKKAILLLQPDGRKKTVHLLQLAISNAMVQDVQQSVDRAIKDTYREWEYWEVMPELVVQLGMDGIPRTGSPIFRWGSKRVYCFDNELLKPVGFLGDKELTGFLFRSVEEQKWLDDLAIARDIDEGRTRVYRDFWGGKTFQSGAEFLSYRRGHYSYQSKYHTSRKGGVTASQNRLSKILDLIKHIEIKGNKASHADIQYLGCLKQKATQLGYCIH